jgi:hypothetical protein
VCTWAAHQDAADVLTDALRNIVFFLGLPSVPLDRVSQGRNLQLAAALHPRQLPSSHFRHTLVVQRIRFIQTMRHTPTP